MGLGVTVSDVRQRALGVDEDFGSQTLGVLLEDAEDLALREFPNLLEHIDSGAVRLATVKRVISNVVIRRLRNPEGIRTIQDSTGPFSGSTTFAGDHPGELYLTDADRKDLSGGERVGRRAFSVMPNYRR